MKVERLEIPLIQPRTQALHCFYRDQWQLINAKRARVLGQHQGKPTLARLANYLPLISIKAMERLGTRMPLIGFQTRANFDLHDKDLQQ